MWKNVLLVLLHIAGIVAATVGLRDFYVATAMLSFLLSHILYSRLGKPDQKKWLFPGGLVLSFIVSGLYYTGEMFVFPHSFRTPHTFSDAYFAGSIWVCSGLFSAAWLSDRQKAYLKRTR